MVNQFVSPQLFTACRKGRVEDVVRLLSSGVGANVTDEVSKVCVQVWVQYACMDTGNHIHILFSCSGETLHFTLHAYLATLL